MSIDVVSPLRQRMMEDMTTRQHRSGARWIGLGDLSVRDDEIALQVGIAGICLR